MKDPFDPKNLRIEEPGAADDMGPVRRTTPRKIAKRREHFVKVPFEWIERLAGAKGQTWCIALHLLYLHWKGGGKPIKLANGMLKIDGVSRHAKYRARDELERRGLISVARPRGRRSPIIHVKARL
jgi:hypothetical protein